MNELFNVNQRLHNFLTKQKKAGGNTTDENRTIGTQATLNNQDVYWSGQNYGWQSQDSYNKLKEGPEFRAGHIASTRSGTDVNQAINIGVDALPEQVKSKAVDVVRQGVQLYQGLPQGIRTGINNVGQSFNVANEFVSKTTKISPIITSEVLTAAGTAGVGNVVKRAATGMNVVADLARTTSRAAKPGFDYYAASTLPTPTNWQTRARKLYGDQNHRELADTFRRGQGGKLSKKNTFITADELALNKGGVLDQQLERADRMEGLRTKWDKTGKQIKGDRQRELYDAASLNPNHQDIEMYSSSSARNYITKFTNILSKDQWHHVFGNKEAGEFILSIANSDPLVAANLFKKMESLGLNSSGVSKNIAILKEAKHTNWHNFIKDMGFEPKSPGKPLSTKGSTAPGDFADLSQELGRAIVSGEADINDAFELIELYAKYNQWMTEQITSKKFGGKIINELPEGVGKAIQIGGYMKRPPKSTFQKLPEV